MSARPSLGALLGALLLGLACLCGGCAEQDPPMQPAPVDPSHSGKTTLQVAGRSVVFELARDDAERERGLMHRASLGADAGMLFLFPDVAYRRFWMRNTLIPLDIVFLDDNGCVINVEEAAAGVEAPGYVSLAPARFVLEFNRGWCAEHGLVAGDCVQIAPQLRDLAR